MKKIFLLAIVGSMGLFATTACSSDDEVPFEELTPNPNPNKGEQLKVVPSKQKLKVNTNVTFTTKSGSTTISDPIYYIDGEPTSSNTYTQKTIGTIEVQARRAGYQDSEVITIEFVQEL